MKPGRFEVIQALSHMNIIKCFGGLKLNQHELLDQQICNIVSDYDAVIEHWCAELLNYLQAGFA